MILIPGLLLDEEAEACDPSMYDPVLFSPVNSQPGSPSRAAFALSAGDRDKVRVFPVKRHRTRRVGTRRLRVSAVCKGIDTVRMS